MGKYSFKLCGVQLQLNTPRELWVEPASEQFLTQGENPDVVVDLREEEEIVQQADLCRSCREKPVWRDGQRIFRGSHDLFREKMHCCTEYDLSDGCRFLCRVRKEDWLWATRSKYLWTGIQLNYILLHHRGLMFHASCIDHEGRGILFAAPSGTGKSTQTELWRVHRGARIINGDKAGITLWDAPIVHGVPFSGTSGICENVSVPLKAVVVLSQSAENKVCRLTPTQSLAAMCPNLFVNQAVPEEWHLALNLLLDLVEQVPVYALACTPDVRAVETLEQMLKEDDA